MYPARLDDKGRLKLPAEFQRYFGSLPDKKLFVTSLDRHIATIYPISVWEQNEQLFETYMDDPEAVETLTFNASDLGAESEMDAQGRIQFSTILRRELDIENQPVRMQAFGAHIEVMSEAMYRASKERFSRAPEEAVKALRKVGLK